MSDEPYNLDDDLDYLEIGKNWRKDSSLETWFPFTAEELQSKTEHIKQLESENAELVKFITACFQDRYARVACLEWVRKHKKCSKP